NFMQRIQKMLAFVLLLAVSVGAFAQSSSGTRVSGRVLEEGTGVPVEFAVVVLSPQAAGALHHDRPQWLF
ncbi:MAG: hypothetical protein II097_03885, partial [Bacteroidales bacterium]|nr:hypothetical protein [Bacteroidales bacterium]